MYTPYPNAHTRILITLSMYTCMYVHTYIGSERVKKSEVVGTSLREAQHINKSLSALGDVIAALKTKATHVPYRNSNHHAYIRVHMYTDNEMCVCVCVCMHVYVPHSHTHHHHHRRHRVSV